MAIFVFGCVLLIIGYVGYGRIVEAAVRPDPNRPTPAVRLADGMDYVVMPTWRIYLVQLLNIAGLGPVFGPIMGALWGPQVFLWVVFGCILGGAVHDMLSGVMSIRNDGAGLPDLIGHYLGGTARHLSTIFLVLLMVLVGTVFVKGPAMLIVQLLPAETVGGWFGDSVEGFLTGSLGGHGVWLWVVMAAIFTYYLLATLLPIDVIIGRVYPFLALALLVMVAGLGFSLLTGRLPVPDFSLANLHPLSIPAWPVIFITVSCGAVSGFHATQSPLMARCMSSEKYLRPVFYGAMIAEGFIALVWACAAQGFYGTTGALNLALTTGGPGQVVHEICTTTMGTVGGLLAVLGVVVLPITSGDTAFRVARLIVGDYLKLPQKSVRNRYLVALPLFAVAFALNFIDFTIIWRYFGWANQTLAAVVLWTSSVFLAKRGNRWWITALPAVFMTVVTTAYIMVERVGLGLGVRTGTIIGIAVGLACLVAFLLARPKLTPEGDDPVVTAHPTEAERIGDDVAC